MTVQELFKNARNLKGNKIREFWKGIGKALQGQTQYSGLPANEIQAYLDLNDSKYTCACGNQSFNCICYSDAE